MKGFIKWTLLCAIIASFLVASIHTHPTTTTTTTAIVKRQDDQDVNDYHNSPATKTSTTTRTKSTSKATSIPRPEDSGSGNTNGNGSSAPQIIAVGGTSWYGEYFSLLLRIKTVY